MLAQDIRLDRDPEVLRIGGFVDTDETAELLRWALLMEPHLRTNGPGRSFLRVHQLPQRPALHAAVAERVRGRVAGHADSVLEPVLTNYLSIIQASGAVHPHTDSAPPGTRHLRCNLFLQLPDAGGRPIIGGLPFDVAERTLLCFFPSSSLHSSEPAAGLRRRVLLSFGLLVPQDFGFQAQSVIRSDRIGRSDEDAR